MDRRTDRSRRRVGDPTGLRCQSLVVYEALDLGASAHFPGSPGGSKAYNITMLDDSNAKVSFVDLFGKDALWFFPEGSATK